MYRPGIFKLSKKRRRLQKVPDLRAKNYLTDVGLEADGNG